MVDIPTPAWPFCASTINWPKQTRSCNNNYFYVVYLKFKYHCISISKNVSRFVSSNTVRCQTTGPKPNILLIQLYRTLGTPTEDCWPGVSTLPDYKANFPDWRTENLKSSVTQLNNADGLDLLERMLVYNPASRITAKAALLHPYFDDLDKSSLPHPITI